MFPFTPGYLKHGRQFVKDARKLVAYKRDLVPGEVIEEVNREIAHLEHAVAARNEAEVAAQMQRLDQVCGKLTKPVEDASWRENVEVFLVAIVIALAVRTYFLQPFTIPTGSMQPTLNGIIATKTEEPPPNILTRIFWKAVCFRTYIDVVAEADESVQWAEEVTRYFFFTYTELRTSAGHRYLVHAPRESLTRYLGLSNDRQYRKGEPIVRGFIDTGDHVFVDKFSYHFIRPNRGEVFVFSTRNIPKLNHEGTPSQYYIKRLAGVPNDDLRIAPPELFVNGKRAEGRGFERVMAGSQHEAHDGYRGYGHGADNSSPMGLLATDGEVFQVPEHYYFALGDNSFNSYDSRGWGPVPEQNITGRALFVYYPFASHFGGIR